MRLIGRAKPEHRQSLYDYCSGNNHTLIHTFEGSEGLRERSFIAMIEFITNHPHAYDALLVLHPSEIATDQLICRMVLHKLEGRKKDLLSIRPFDHLDNKNGFPAKNEKIYERYEKDAARIISKSPVAFQEFPDININVAEGPCFMQCRFCYQQKNPPEDLNYLMPENLFKKIVDETPYEEQSLFNLTCGGETLAFPAFFDYMEYASKKRPNISFACATNGVLLEGEIAERLSKIRNLSILVSLNAPSREEYRWFTQRDYYDRVCRNIKKFMELKKRFGIIRERWPKLLVQLITLKKWEKQIQEAKDCWENIVDHVLMNPASFCENDPDLTNIEERIRASDISHHQLQESRYVPLCIFLMKNLMVGRGGSISLCCADGLVPGASNFIKSLNIKTAHEEMAANIWNNTIYDKLRWINIQGKPIMKACIGCTKGKMFDFETDILAKARLRREFRGETAKDSKISRSTKKVRRLFTAYGKRTNRLLGFHILTPQKTGRKII